VEDQPAPERIIIRTRYRNRGCGCGAGGFFLVLTLGIVLSLFNADVGIGASLRIPFTQSNVTITGAIGAKSKLVDALPAYAKDRLGGNQNLYNSSATLTIGPAEGAALFIIGKQDDAPALDLHLVAR